MPLLRFGCLLFCFGWLGFAQQTATPPAKKTAPPPPGIVHAVIVAGNKVYPTDEIVKVLGLKPGQPANPAAFKQAQERLLHTDLFSDVSYEFRYSMTKPPQFEVTYRVSEFAQLFR